MQNLDTNMFDNTCFEYFTKSLSFSRYKIDTIFKIHNKFYLNNKKAMTFSR